MPEEGRRVMKVAIVGSRNYPKFQDVVEYVRKLPPETTIISGGARGVDAVAERTAKECHLNRLIFYPDWENEGRRAGFIRNERIVQAADKVVAFWDGRSRGTANAIELARKYKKELEIIRNSV